MRVAQRPLLLPRIARLPVVRDRVAGRRPALQLPVLRGRIAARTFPARRDLEGDHERRGATYSTDSVGKNIETVRRSRGPCEGQKKPPQHCDHMFGLRRAGDNSTRRWHAYHLPLYFGWTDRLSYCRNKILFT